MPLAKIRELGLWSWFRIPILSSRQYSKQFLKCINDDSDIFFYYSKINTNKVIWKDNVVYNEFEVIINFKNPIPRKRKYFCHAQLMSDTKGKMGNSIGTLFVNVN